MKDPLSQMTVQTSLQTPLKYVSLSRDRQEVGKKNEFAIHTHLRFHYYKRKYKTWSHPLYKVVWLAQS